MEASTLLPPRRGDINKMIRCSEALHEAVKKLADDLNYPMHDVVNAGLEMVLVHFNQTVPPIK